MRNLKGIKINYSVPGGSAWPRYRNTAPSCVWALPVVLNIFPHFRPSCSRQALSNVLHMAGSKTSVTMTEETTQPCSFLGNLSRSHCLWQHTCKSQEGQSHLVERVKY